MVLGFAHHRSPSQIGSDQRSQPITDTWVARTPTERSVFFVSNPHSTADFGFPIAISLPSEAPILNLHITAEHAMNQFCHHDRRSGALRSWMVVKRIVSAILAASPSLHVTYCQVYLWCSLARDHYKRTPWEFGSVLYKDFMKVMACVLYGTRPLANNALEVHYGDRFQFYHHEDQLLQRAGSQSISHGVGNLNLVNLKNTDRYRYRYVFCK